jgi:type I restriction enzyme S subunit
MTDWIQTSLGELCVVTMGQSPPSNTYNTEKNGLPFFQGKAEFSDLYPIPKKWCSKPQKIADEKDILISVRAPVGDVNFANQHCCIGRGLAAIKYDTCSKFIFYYLKHSKNELDKLSTGTTFKAISKQTILNFSLFIPSLKEQNEIVSKIEKLFSELDNGIENLKKAREQLKTYRQAVLKHAFEGKLTREWREQQIQAGNPPEPAEKLLARIKKERETRYHKLVKEWQKACDQAKRDGSKKPAKPKKLKDLQPPTEKELAELPEVPEGWGWVTLEMILSDTLIGIVKNLSEQNEMGIGVPYVKMNNISKFGTMDYSSLAYVTIREDEKNKYSLKVNDILFNTRNSYELVGKTGIVKKVTGYTVFNNNLMRMRFFVQVNPIMIWYQINSPQFQKELERKKKATTNICALYGKDIFPMKIKVTNLLEQNELVSEIETRLSVCDKLEQTIEDSLKKAGALRQSILKKAFEGELTKEWREAHPELISGENSAESLLARIRAEKARLADEVKKRRSGKAGKK